MIYLDNHATTPCDPEVLDAMLPWMTEHFGNPHSDSHRFGRQAADAIGQALHIIAERLGAPEESVVITSGATESVWLAIRGVCTHPRQKRRRIVSVATEHPAVLDVLHDLAQEGFEVTTLAVSSDGIVDMTELEAVMGDDVALVTAMWANNEMGAVSDMKSIAEFAHRCGALVHSDATQAVGRILVDAREFDVDILSGSAHKFYGPKGIGFTVVGNGNRRVRLRPLISGGCQQRGRRGGTMNPAATIAMAKALELATQTLGEQSERIANLRDHLWDRLHQQIPGVQLNGPALSPRVNQGGHRLPGNLNLTLPDVEGETWMAATPTVAFSSGSACSSVDPAPSHVLSAMGLSESEARRSVRFGVGRFNTQDEIDRAAEALLESYGRLKP
ncbi:MAG: cysteine desulfurase family protein [Planctomycetota bacterium]